MIGRNLRLIMKDRTITYIMSESMNIEAVNSLFPYMYNSHMYFNGVDFKSIIIFVEFSNKVKPSTIHIPYYKYMY